MTIFSVRDDSGLEQGGSGGWLYVVKCWIHFKVFFSLWGGWEKKRVSKLTPQFLAWVTGGVELSFTEIKKTERIQSWDLDMASSPVRHSNGDVKLVLQVWTSEEKLGLG